jgi:DNA-binding Lrp family transcriptional regulator
LKVVTADRLQSLVSEDGGLSTSAVAERTGAKREHVLRLLRELEASGRIRRTGQRSSTRWHPITDEDRIRERAAELEARRKNTA